MSALGKVVAEVGATEIAPEGEVDGREQGAGMIKEMHPARPPPSGVAVHEPVEGVDKGCTVIDLSICKRGQLALGIAV